MSPALKARSLSVRFGSHEVLRDIDLDIPLGTCIAVIGGTASGKTTLLNALAARCFHTGTVDIPHPLGRKAVCLIPRQHRFTNRANLPTFYYQQRFHSSDVGEARTVGEELQSAGPAPSEVPEALARFGIGHLLDAPLICLSNGEHKRFQLARALLQRPSWLLLDNPFVGLDAAARAHLDGMLASLAAEGMGVLLCGGPGNVPSCATTIALLEQGRLRHADPAEGHVQPPGMPDEMCKEIGGAMAPLPQAFEYPSFEIAVRMRQVTIAYGGRRILSGLDWEVRKGECWSISGPNGSGKSTLLSLVNADCPQAYGQDIALFDRRRGSGESIWDVKRMIGYVSPELHQHFEASIDAYAVVASGLFDTIGLFTRLDERKREAVDAILDRMRIGHLAERRFHTLSDGEQRQVLLARALVKDPPMLILDEPCQGLDTAATRYFNAIVERECRASGKTLLYVSHYAADIPACVTRQLELPPMGDARS